MVLQRYAYQRKAYLEKYNPHHDASGRFTTSDQAHISIARDGTRTLGPKHPSNQKPDALTALRVKPTDAWMQGYEKIATPHREKYAKAHGLSVAEYVKKVDTLAQDLVKTSTLFTRVKPSVLQKILDEGRFKSQFETNKTGGTLAKDLRNDFESNVFSFDEDTSGVEQRPVYGYLSKDAHGENTDADVSQYGKIALEMKPEMRDRSTVTSGDSLAMTGGRHETLVPRPVNAPDASIFSLTADDPLTSSYLKYRYTEAQMHGGVKASDILSATFHGKAPSGALKAALKKAGIPYTVL